MKNKNNTICFVFMSFLFLSCHKAKEPECTIEKITAEISSKIFTPNDPYFQIKFLLVGTCKNTVDFDCLLEIERLEDSTYLVRGTFLVEGFNGADSVVVNYPNPITTPGTYRIFLCPDFSNKIQELNEHNCQ
jgi:hypothetical protein